MNIERFIVEKVDWKDLEDKGYTSVTDYCRYLAKTSPEDLPNRIEVYRGEMLCLSVNDVREAAELQPSGNGFVKYNPPPSIKRQRKAIAIAQD